MVRTAFTDGFGLALPMVGAPMVGASYAELAGAVSKAGGLGMVGCGGLIAVSDIPRCVALWWIFSNCYTWQRLFDFSL